MPQLHAVPIYMGSSCNRSCEFCSPCAMQHSDCTEDEAYSETLTRIQQLPRGESLLPILSGGDALAKRYITRLLEFLIALNYSDIGITTTGDLLDKYKEILLKVRRLYIYLECIGVTEEYLGLQGYRHSPVGLSESLDYIYAAFGMATLERATVRVILTHKTIDCLEDVLRVCEDKAVRHVELFLPRMCNFVLKNEYSTIDRFMLSLSELKQGIATSPRLAKFQVGLVNIPLCLYPHATYCIVDAASSQVLDHKGAATTEFAMYHSSECSNYCAKPETLNCCGIPQEYYIHEQEDLHDILNYSSDARCGTDKGLCYN